MKNTLVRIVGLLAMANVASAQDAKSLLHQGLFAEEAEGKLEKAAASYQQIIADHDAGRAFAVAAIYRLAEVRRKQEQNDEAAKLYQRILVEFADADPQARLSRENLTAMGFTTPADAQSDTAPTDPDEEKELRKFEMLAENSLERIWEPVPLALNDTGSETASPLSKAARRGRLKVVSWLLDDAKQSGRDIAEELNTALHDAAFSGKVESCDLLLKRGADIKSADGVLVRAIQQNFDDVAEWLIKNGTDINAMGLGELPAVDGKMAETTDRLSGETVTLPATVSYWISPLATAIGEDDKHWVDRLLDLKADVNAKLENENESYRSALSALTVACWKGHAPLVRKLLELGANPNAIDSSYAFELRTPPATGPGWTPLHYGAGNPEIVVALLNAGAAADPKDTSGVTPLHVACHFGELEAVHLLLERGADANSKGTFQKENSTRFEATPLMVAALHPNSARGLAVIELLVAHGADPFFRNAEGADVFQICTIPDPCSQLMQTHFYPRLSATRTVSIAFPDSGASFTLATEDLETGRQAPLPLSELIANWTTDEIEIRQPNGVFRDHSIQWELLTLRRADAAGKFSRIPIKPLEEQKLPELQWGDIIEVAFNPATSTSANPEPVSETSNLPRILEGFHSQKVSAMVPPPIKYALLASTPKKITVQLPGEEPRRLVISKGVTVSTPFGPLRESRYHDMLLPLATGRNQQWPEISVQRDPSHGGDTITGETARYSDPEDGDIVTVLAIEPFTERSSSIQLIEPRSQFQIYSIKLSEEAMEKVNSERTGDEMAFVPTLFQFIAEAYPPTDIYWLFELVQTGEDSGHYRFRDESSIRGTMLKKHIDTLIEAFMSDPGSPLPEDVAIIEALSANARQAPPRADYNERILPHPDFSSVRIRRLSEDGSETTIDVPIGEFIQICTQDTPASECRNKDIDLQPGDIVEIRSIYGQIDQPWAGFDDATARFFEKALTYDIGIQSIGIYVRATISWKSPRFYNTTAGPVGVVEKGELLSSLDDMGVYAHLSTGKDPLLKPKVSFSHVRIRKWFRQDSIYKEAVSIVPPRHREILPR